MAEVLCVGHLVADVVARPVRTAPRPGRVMLVEELGLHLGGCAANSAVGLAKLGARAGVVGRVGADVFGDFVLEALRGYGVETAGVARDPETNTAATMVLVRPDAERSLVHCVGANGRVVEEDVREELVEGTKLIHIGGALILPALDGEPLARALRRAKERGLKTSVDTAWDDRGRWMEALAPALPHVDYFLPSIEEARMLTGRREPPEVAEALLEAGAKTVALKMGVGGCYLRAGEQEVRLPAYEVESVDSTGAGDAFVAGFLFGVLRGWDLESCGRLGNAAGALCTRAVGTTEGLRGLEETLDFARRAKVRDEG